MRPLLRFGTLGVCALVLTACAVRWALQGDQTRRIEAFLATFALAAAAYAGALIVTRERLPARVLWVLLALAAVWRVGLVGAAPMVSDDMFRYVWEGRIQLHGGNPYAWTDRPEAKKWRGLHDPIWTNVGHKSYTAVYPPLWQLASRAVVALHDSLAAMKLFVVLCELALWAVLLRLLARRGLPRERILIAAWSPLALVEFAGSGHNDVFAMLWAALALLALDSGRPLLSACAAALGAQAKLLPGLLAVPWLRRYRAAHVIAAAVLAAALCVPYLGAGRGLGRSLSEYAQYWHFNDSGFALLALVLPHNVAVAAASLLALAWALALAWRSKEPATAALLVSAAYLLLAPNVLPWYALWLLPWLVLRDAPAAWLYTLTAPLAYLVYPGWLAGGPWKIGWGVRAFEYGPCLLVAVAPLIARVWRRGPAEARS